MYIIHPLLWNYHNIIYETILQNINGFLIVAVIAQVSRLIFSVSIFKNALF